ncbi:unnamed protein product [Heterobilharzia americana]|nr:unnamed protein product [Heterobilharzia americana]
MSMLLVSVQQPVVVFRIVYMVMLIYFMFIFQISYSAWRRQMLCFWWFIVVYSMAMLLCIYTFQFNESPSFWQHKLGLSSEILKAFGLETFESAALFERLLTPVVFLVVIILQVHYFHIPFLEASALDRFRLPQVSKGSVYSRSGLSDDQNSVMSVSPSSTMSNFIEDVNSAFQIVVSKLYCWAVSLTNHCWRFLEIHWIKIVGLVIILTCTNEVSAANIISLIFLVICFPFPYLHGFMATVVFIWTSVQILCKMTFQLNAVNLNLSSSCSLKYDNATAWDLTAWIGLKKVENFGQYIMPYGALMVVSVIWHAITYRQRQFYNSDRNTRPDEGIVFPGVTINSMGYDLLNVVKFAFNYGFYKFGLELCHCVTVVTACSRVDAFSVLYLLLMLVFLFSPRRLCARLWVSYMVILAVLIPIQYGCCLGLPPGLCVKYPWYTESVEVNNLLQWLYLPSEFGVPSAYKLTADFFQFVVVALQFRIFKIEQQPAAEKLGGGSNRPILTDELPTEGDRDFVSTKESYLDYMRHLIFYWSYWVSLAVVLVTGVVWITLFCLGYMILSFIYLWMGLNVMLRKRTNLINSWNVIIGYNFCVILAKCSLQLMGCVYWSRMADRCWLIQLFGVQCMNPMSWNHFQLPIGYETSCAAVSSGLHWDVICFIFILFQRKVFTSHSFSHVFLDLQVQSQFASRGAYLINRKLMLAIHEQAMEEQYNLTKVQQKINRIQQRQEAFGRSNANVTEHYIMLRSGDYYLFEGDPEEDDDFVNRETHIIGHDSDHSDKDDASPPPSMMRMRESKNNLKCPRSTVSEEPEKQLTTPSATVMNSRTSKSQVTLVPRGKNYLRDVWPSIDPNVLDILSNYTDPYSTIRNERRRGRPSSQGRSALESEQHREQPQFPDMYEDFTNPGPALGHRRMRSHPEFLRRHFADIKRILILSYLYTLRSTQTSPSPFNEQITYRTAERRDLNGPPIRHRPHETHRRLFSASEAIFSSKDRPSSPEKCTIVKNAIRSHRRPTKISLSKSSPPKALGPSTAHGITQSQSSSYANKTSNIDLDCMDDSGKALTVTNGGESKRNDVMFPETISHNTIGVTSQIHTPLIADQNAFSYTYFDDGQEADRDSDEEDDANPPSTPNTRLNPIQLLNRAMELGALSAVKQYRRSLHAHSQGLRQREQVDASQPHVLLGSQEGSVIDEMMPTSSSMQQVVVHPFPHKLPKDKSYYHPEFRRKFTQFPSKSGLRKFSVPDIHSCSKSPGVHFSRRLIKQSDSPLVDQEVESSEHCYTTPPQDYLGQPSVSGYNYINSKTGSDDHQRITMSGRVAGRDLVHSLILPSSGTDMLDSKFRSSEGIKYSSKDKNDFHDSENTKRKCDSTQNPAFNVCKPTQHFEPNNNLNESSHFPIFTVRDGQDGEENDQIIKHVNREKSILPAHSSQQLGDNSSPCDLNDNQPANTQGKTRRHSVHEPAGIPDFRSSSSGIYDNLEEFNLPNPMAVFSIDYFRRNPKAFFEVARRLYRPEAKPTLAHYFIRLLHEKGILLRHYTQNVDNLERLSGLPEEKLIEAHGTFNTGHCIDCKEQYDFQFMLGKIMAKKIPVCVKCQGVVKPDVVFFGEDMPKIFYKNLSSDFSNCDLLIIMGTSLTVLPFVLLFIAWH